MTTPVAEFPSITALAKAIGVRTAVAWKRVSKLRSAKLPITRDAVEHWVPMPRKKREPSAIKRAVFRAACASLALKAGCTPAAMRERLRRKTPEEALRPRKTLSGAARDHGMMPVLAHQRVVRGASPDEAVKPFWGPGLISAAKRARPGKLHGNKLPPCVALRRHLAVGLTLAQALDAETAAAWARIEGKAA